MDDIYAMKNKYGLFFGRAANFGALIKAVCDGVLTIINAFGTTFKCPEIQATVRFDIFMAYDSIGFHAGVNYFSDYSEF